MTDVHLRMVWPEWQGAGSTSIREFLPELPFDVARRAYTTGTAVLQAILPAHDGPTAVVPVPMDDAGLVTRDGIEAKDAVLAQLDAALAIIREHRPARITTVGGNCGVSLAPFSAMAERYGDDLAMVWVDSHPDMGTGQSDYPGHHAMVVSALTGRGDAEVLERLPGRIPAERIALAGMHDWTDETLPPLADEWGLTVLPPDRLRDGAAPLLAWLRGTGASHVAIHFDVDTVDADEVRLGLGADRGGLSGAQANRVVAEVAAELDVVALTIAEYVPRQAIRLRQILDGFPLL